MSNPPKCPFTHGGKTTLGAQSNRHWWPNQLNLAILHQHHGHGQVSQALDRIERGIGVHHVDDFMGDAPAVHRVPGCPAGTASDLCIEGDVHAAPPR